MREWQEQELDEKSEERTDSSFRHHAVPLDQIQTLDENGVPFSLKELSELKDLREELE